MAISFAFVFATVIVSLANLTALEGPNPIPEQTWPIKGFYTRLFVPAVATRNGFRNLSAVAAGIYTDLAGPTETFVAKLLTGMYSTRHEIVTSLTAAPTSFIIRINTSPGYGFFATETAQG